MKIPNIPEELFQGIENGFKIPLMLDQLVSDSETYNLKKPLSIWIDYDPNRKDALFHVFSENLDIYGLGETKDKALLELANEFHWMYTRLNEAHDSNALGSHLTQKLNFIINLF